MQCTSRDLTISSGQSVNLGTSCCNFSQQSNRVSIPTPNIEYAGRLRADNIPVGPSLEECRHISAVKIQRIARRVIATRSVVATLITERRQVRTDYKADYSTRAKLRVRANMKDKPCKRTRRKRWIKQLRRTRAFYIVHEVVFKHG